VPTTRIEDALYAARGIALCVVTGHDDPEHGEVPIAAIQLHPNIPLDLAAISAAVATLPEYARPRRLRVVDALPMTDGFRPIKRVVHEMDLTTAYVWDARGERYVAPSIARIA